MAFECNQDVANDLEKSLKFDEGHDVIIYAGENKNVQDIHTHSIILRVRKFIFRKPDISPELFKMILR
jgi:hypothetical protein